MSLLEKIFPLAKENPRTMIEQTMFKSLTAYQPHFTTWNGALYENELVRSAIDARARHISKLKIEVMGSAQPKLQRRLAQQPNEWQTWSQFMYRTSTILDMQNNCCIVPVINGYGEAVGLFPVLPQKCELREYNDKLWLRYEFNNGQIGAVEFERCALITKHQYKDDFFGESNRALTETMQLMHIHSEGIEEAVKNSATYRFMAQLSNFSTPEDLASERKAFTEANLKSDVDGGGLLLFPNVYKDIKQIDTKPYTPDADQMELIRTNVYNYFGVNEDVMQNKISSGDAWNAFYEGAIEPIAIQISEALTKALFTSKEIASGSKVLVTANRLQYMNNADKLSMSAQMADRGIMSINEIRELWNLPPVEDGDVRTIRGEYYTIDEKGGEEDGN